MAFWPRSADTPWSPHPVTETEHCLVRRIGRRVNRRLTSASAFVARDKLLLASDAASSAVSSACRASYWASSAVTTA
jgi:hypothetical protein